MTFCRITRRNFLSEAATVFGGALLSPAGNLVLGRAADDGPHVAFPAPPRERIAIASYLFREFITPGKAQEKSAAAPAAQTTKMELKDFAAHVVEKFKIHRIEPWSVHFVSQEPRYLAEMRAAFDKAQVSVVNIAVDGQH